MSPLIAKVKGTRPLKLYLFLFNMLGFILFLFNMLGFILFPFNMLGIPVNKARLMMRKQSKLTIQANREAERSRSVLKQCNRKVKVSTQQFK